MDKIREYGLRQWIGFITVAFWLTLGWMVDAPEGLSDKGWSTVIIGLILATLWITETLPIPITALLPLILFPLTGVSDIKTTSAHYANPIIFLFMGGFLIALGIQKCNLHKRIALVILSIVGNNPIRVIFGFMGVTAFISMWVSNTATVLMMYPIGLSIIGVMEKHALEIPEKQFENFCTALMLGIAYSASIGGIGTLIGTPPNAIMAAYIFDHYNVRIDFVKWMLLGVPIIIITVPICLVILSRVIFPINFKQIEDFSSIVDQERKELGTMTISEKAVSLVCLWTCLMWILCPLLEKQYPFISDTVIAMIGGVVIFMIPVSFSKGIFLMSWNDTKEMPWGLFILFGGGLALGAAVQSSGLSEYISAFSKNIFDFPVVMILLSICFVMIFLGELASNTAIVSTFLPIVGAIAVGIGQDPILFLMTATIAGSCGFMLPISTPPNAIIFGSNRLSIGQMAKAGAGLNILFMLFIPIYMIFFYKLVF